MTSLLEEATRRKYFSRGCWNDSESFWSSSGMMYNALNSSNILFITETHASPIKLLPNIAGYHWFSAYQQKTKSSCGIKGSCNFAYLTKDSLWSKVSLVASDEFGKFMWIRLSGLTPLPRDLYIVVCYFPPNFIQACYSWQLQWRPVPRFVLWQHPTLNNGAGHPTRRL